MIVVAVVAEVAADVVVVVVVVVDVVGVRARGGTVAKPQGQYYTYISSARNLFWFSRVSGQSAFACHTQRTLARCWRLEPEYGSNLGVSLFHNSIDSWTCGATEEQTPASLPQKIPREGLDVRSAPRLKH